MSALFQQLIHTTPVYKFTPIGMKHAGYQQPSTNLPVVPYTLHCCIRGIQARKDAVTPIQLVARLFFCR